MIPHRLRAWWRDRPRGAIPAIFDGQPLTVTASGGRRDTREERLVLARTQTTRGRFPLSLLYGVNRGLAPWSFYPGMGAVEVCRSLRRVRRWSPRQRVRIAWDRDPAPPIKAHVARPLLRRPGRNWTSLAKRSAGDNPAETSCSDIQPKILDNREDPDERTTRGRISRHLRRRDRRPDRFVRIGYLVNTPRK